MNDLVKHIKYALLSGVIIFVVMKVISVLLGSPFMVGLNLGIQFLWYMLYATVLYGVNLSVYLFFDKRYGKEIYSISRLLLGFVSSVIVTLCAVFFLRIVEDVIVEGKTFTAFLNNESPRNYVVPFVITVVVSLFFISFYSFKVLQEKKIKQQKIIAGTANAKYESLKSQLDPHFLFNSLNVLVSLIEEDPDKAQKFTTSLSKVYRYVLEQKDKDLVYLEEELAFAKTYMLLLKMRFENAVDCTIPEKAHNPEAKIVPLSLQILLENCIKHNIVSEQQPLHISIVESENNLIVTNNFQEKKTLNKSSGIGLKNITERYQILSTRTISINQSKSEFKVELPLLTKKASIMKTTSSHTNYENARKRLENLKGFYWSLFAYIIVIPFLMFVNFKTSWHQHKWFFYPMLGWGVGLAFQAYEVYGKDKYFGKSWENRKLEEFMKEEETNLNRWE